MDFVFITLLNALSYGLVLFLITSGLTLGYGLMGVMNFAHTGFYMLGAYLAYSVSQELGFAAAFVLVPLMVGGLGWVFEAMVLRHAYRVGHQAEMLVTFGCALLVAEGVQLIWGTGPVAYDVPPELATPLWVVGVHQVSTYRVFAMVSAVGVLAALWYLHRKTRWGLLIQAASTHPGALSALGYNVVVLLRWVFAGGCALAGLAGVLMGNAYVTEPGMALHMGAIAFAVVVMGGLGSVSGAFLASLAVGVLQTFAMSWSPAAPYAPLLPYALLVVTMVMRPQGWMGLAGQAWRS